MEGREFRNILMLLRSELGEVDIPRRTTLRKEVMMSWVKWFVGLRDQLQVHLANYSLQELTLPQAAHGRISLTLDVWSDKPNRRSYICITAHWIGHDSKKNMIGLHNEILAFHHLPHDSHDGRSMAKLVVAMLDRAQMTNKVLR